MKHTAILELKNASRLVFQNKLKLLACVIAEILFFFIYGLATAPIYQKLVQYTNIIGALASDALTAAAREQNSVMSVLSSEAIKPYLIDVLLLLLLLCAVAFLLYCVFQSFIWNMSLSMAGRKIRYLDYLKKFMLVNTVWLLFFIIYYFAGFAVEIRGAAIKTIAQAAPSNALHIVLSAYLVIVFYFAVISYVDLSAKKSFGFGVRNIRELLPAWLIIAAYFLILQLVLSQVMQLNYIAGIAVGIIITIPSLTIARVYISRVIQKI